MFTGIITDLGRVRSIAPGGATRFSFDTGYDTAAIAEGASIACSGACLSVVDKGSGWFAVDASAETLACTTLGAWRVGTPVNFERALRVGDELGGHLVSGHVDGVATVLDSRPDGDSLRFTIAAPSALRPFIASKGSVTLDGVSLTVNEVDAEAFGVNVIPITQRLTTFGDLRPGDRVNLEIDLLARYVARLLERGAA
ncbi:riboflavin synthase [Rhodospirillaceae bacterium SYSU D60014]|uniref:riboflavin synthase n=1 Tax=Virgifigura deserti TaxID=2268457 RepID=UPI000E65F5D0